MQNYKSVDVAVKELNNEWSDGSIFDSHRVFRMKDIARKMHSQYWKYRDEILPKIQEWFRELHPFDVEKYSPLVKRIEINDKLYMVTTAHGMRDTYGHFVEGGYMGGSGCLLCLDRRHKK